MATRLSQNEYDRLREFYPGLPDGDCQQLSLNLEVGQLLTFTGTYIYEEPEPEDEQPWW